MLLNNGKHPFHPRYPTKKEFTESFPNIRYEQPLHASSLARDLLQRLL
jgi:calcium-dependent protein kinase